MKLDTFALTELAKSFGRFIWFGLLGLVAAFLTSLATDQSLANAHVEVAGVSLPVGFLIMAGVAGAVKLLDRYRHESLNNDSNGLAPPFLQP
jgi:hypothetical protein